jgi:tol-pal system protein YbgF
MRKSLLLMAVVCLLVADIQIVSARDVQLRSRSGDATSTLGVPSNANTQQLSTEERVKRLERILDSQGLVDMLLRIENLQNELQILRGEIELHNHELEQIKQRQRDLYVDIDRRLLRMERNGVQPGAAVAPAQGKSATASSTPSSPAASKSAQTAMAKPATSEPAKPAADFADEQKAYQHAFDLLRELRYDQAVTAFQKFIKKYPEGRYAHIAQYWIGEANYAQRKFSQAIKDYQKLIDKYPKSPKLAEAMLKIGYSQYELKNYKQAESTLKNLAQNYPGTTEAGQAQNLIQKIRINHRK